MFQDDRCGIGWGRFVPMSPLNFGSFDGVKFTLKSTEKIGLMGQLAI